MNVSESIFDENIPLMMEKSKEEPVFIFGEDEPKYVLLSFEAYNALLDVGSDR
jgi:PHD/YefM family antitoxin component YafN of YafNO toxin-antitoxin module